MSAESNPSSCEIIEAKLTSFDGRTVRDISSNFITSFELIQSMDKVSYSGVLAVLDTAGVLEGMPLRGEEKLDLTIKSFDLNTEVKIKAFVHKVSDIIPTQSSNGSQYKIHFVSRITFEAGHKRVIEAFRGSISGVASEIFGKFFSKLGDRDFLDPDNRSKVLPFATARYTITDEPERNLFVQPTAGVTSVIIPRLTPTEAMYFVASKAYNPESPSQTYRFFETFENYYFCTDEYFLKDVKDNETLNLFYAPVVDMDPKNISGQLNRVENIHVLNKGIDTGTDIFSGAYRSEVVEIDLIRRKLEYNKFNFDDAQYLDMFGQPRDLSANPHTEEFRAQYFREDNAKRFMIFRDYQRPGDIPGTLSGDRHFSEIAQNRVSYYHHLNNTSVIATMKGRLDIRPGKIANLDIKTLDGTDGNVGVNKSLSGRYLIQRVVHAMDPQGTLNTTLKMAKFDWSAQANESAPATGEVIRN